MKTSIETIYYDGSEIYELAEEYIPKSVKAKSETGDVEIEEVGGTYISIKENPGLQPGSSVVTVYYTPKRSLPEKRSINKSQKDLEERIVALEKELAIVKKALDNRVDLNTFSTWLKSLETELGVDVIKNIFQKPYPL